MGNDYKIDEQEALRLAEKGKELLARGGVEWDKHDYELVTFRELLVAYADAEREAGKPWIIQEINKWKRWLRRK